MKAENRAFLDANRHHYNLLIKSGIVKHLDGNTREGLLRIIREEFAPNYIASTWCQSCVADSLKFAYIQYDKWITENPEPVAAPASIEGQTVKTTFPKHTRKRGKK